MLNWKKFLLVWFVILRLFVKSFTADNKYSRCNLHILIQIQTPLSLKQKTISRFFIAVLKCEMKFRKFWIESWESYLNYFQNYILRKSSLLKRLKDLASEHHSSKQRFNGFQTLLKSAGHYYYLIFPWIWDILNWKKSLLVWFVILRLFVNSLTADNKFSRCNLHILTQIQTPLSLKQKTFCPFFIAVLKCAWNLEVLNIKLSILGLIISRNYILRKSSLLKRPKRSCFRTPFSKQRFNGFQTLLKSARHYYYLIFPWFWDMLNWKKFLLVWFVILRLFVKSFTADNKYSRCNLHILIQIQTPLSLKQKTISRFFIAVLKCEWNLENFE